MGNTGGRESLDRERGVRLIFLLNPLIQFRSSIHFLRFCTTSPLSLFITASLNQHQLLVEWNQHEMLKPAACGLPQRPCDERPLGR